VTPLILRAKPNVHAPRLKPAGRKGVGGDTLRLLRRACIRVRVQCGGVETTSSCGVLGQVNGGGQAVGCLRQAAPSLVRHHTVSVVVRQHHLGTSKCKCI
jgi:hypothetical protein